MKKSLLLFIAVPFSVFTSAAQISLGTGLALSYPFTGNANDVSGNGLNGVVNNATLTTDRFGNPNQAYLFNGSSSYIDCDNILNSVFAGAGNKFSFSLWLKPHAVMTNNMIIAKIADGACGEDQRQFYFRLWNSKIMFGYSSTLHTGNYRYPTGSTLITDTSKWYHIVIMYDGTIASGGGMDRVKIFVDNVPETISAGAPSTGTLGNIQVGTASMGIGNMLNTTGGACTPSFDFNGKIDDLRIYDRPLNLQEISALFFGPTDVGITENEVPVSYNVFPNPSTGLINVTFRDLTHVKGISVYSALGQCMFHKSIDQDNTLTYVINMDNQPKGIYFLQIETSLGKLSKKIVIAK